MDQGVRYSLNKVPGRLEKSESYRCTRAEILKINK